MSHHHHDHDYEHEHDHQHNHQHDGENPLAEEQEQIARGIGAELSEAFVEYVLGRLPFEDLAFGVVEALGDLSVVASGAYELEAPCEGDGEAGDAGADDQMEAAERKRTEHKESAE